MVRGHNPFFFVADRLFFNTLSIKLGYWNSKWLRHRSYIQPIPENVTRILCSFYSTERMEYKNQGFHWSGKSGKIWQFFFSQGKKTKVFGHNQGKICQSGNFFKLAEFIFANYVFLHQGNIRLSGFLSISRIGLVFLEKVLLLGNVVNIPVNKLRPHQRNKWYLLDNFLFEPPKKSGKYLWESGQYQGILSAQKSGNPEKY